jgi:hypothetical protein
MDSQGGNQVRAWQGQEYAVAPAPMIVDAILSAVARPDAGGSGRWPLIELVTLRKNELENNL